MTNMKLQIQTSLLFAIPIFVIQLILFGFNYDNVDMPNYINRFEVIKSRGFSAFDNEWLDIGFNYINYAFSWITTEYQVLLFSIGVVCLYLSIKSCQHYKASHFVFAILFFFSVFFIEAVIVRQYLASLLFTYATCMLFNEQHQKRHLLFFVLIALSISIHVTLVLTILYYIIAQFRVRNVVILSLIGLLIFSISVNALLPVLSSLGDKYATYAEATSAGLLSILAKMVHIIMTILVVYLGYQYMLKFKTFFDQYQIDFSEFVLKISIVNITLLPLMDIGMSFERLLLIPVFLFLIQASMVLSMRLPLNIDKMVIILGWTVWVIFSYRVFVWSDAQGTIEAILNYNLLKDLL